MKIYFPHGKQLDYKEFYSAIRTSPLFSKHTCIFPYEKNAIPENSKDIIQNADLIIAEVSFPATGLGIELGWANDLKKRIVCVYKKESHISGSLKYISDEFISYNDFPDLIKKIKQMI